MKRKTMTREQRKQRRMNFLLDALIVAGIVACIVSVVLVVVEMRRTAEAIDEAQRVIEVSEAVQAQTVIAIDFAEVEIAEPEPEPIPEVNEAEKIEAALLASGYLSDSIPLSYELQDVLRTACYEFDVPYALALAVMEQETRFEMKDGDGGNAIGYFQVWPKWWGWLADEIGADLNDPTGNIRTGCAVIRHLLDLTDGDITAALGKYNTRPTYPAEVMARMEKWETVVVE